MAYSNFKPKGKSFTAQLFLSLTGLSSTEYEIMCFCIRVVERLTESKLVEPETFS